MYIVAEAVLWKMSDPIPSHLAGAHGRRSAMTFGGRRSYQVPAKVIFEEFEPPSPVHKKRKLYREVRARIQEAYCVDGWSIRALTIHCEEEEAKRTMDRLIFQRKRILKPVGLVLADAYVD